jgi:predicted ATPase
MHLTRITLLRDEYPTDQHYPFNLPIFQETTELVLTSPVVFFVGENGTGKSTLLEAVARRCGVTIWRGEQRVRYVTNPFEGRLSDCVAVEWENGWVSGSFFASEIFRSFAKLLDEWAASDPGILDYFGGASLLTQSHGESFLSFFRTRYRKRGLYFLDEPDTALSPRNQVALLDILENSTRAGHAQFLIATHSPILLSCPGAVIYSFDHIPPKQLRYSETEHYKVLKEIMDKMHTGG